MLLIYFGYPVKRNYKEQCIYHYIDITRIGFKVFETMLMIFFFFFLQNKHNDIWYFEKKLRNIQHTQETIHQMTDNRRET